MKPLAARLCGSLLVFGLILEPTLTSAQAEAAAANTPETQQTAAGQPGQNLPNSPGADQNPGQNSGTSAAQTGSAQPTGTAAAPAVQVSGNPVSRPAGAAIAPPKQHRVRSLLIKMGFIAGAGVALGTVAALSWGSPGRVPGSPSK